ncbi:hypothetical protein [Bradyrhizobium sp. S3.2.6]|uniref:hypothetical protein n=1 Tax=Bradyrhizobium sp. S3.2.6 TaxID=3156428 RepID=UPI003390AC53
MEVFDRREVALCFGGEAMRGSITPLAIRAVLDAPKVFEASVSERPEILVARAMMHQARDGLCIAGIDPAFEIIKLGSKPSDRY